MELAFGIIVSVGVGLAILATYLHFVTHAKDQSK
jgi:hypothetical protein